MKDKKFSARRVKQIVKVLTKCRADREAFLSETDNQKWKEWITSPLFYINWIAANCRDNELALDVSYYAVKLKPNRWFDIAGVIKAMYEEPEKWCKNEHISLKKCVEDFGQP